MPTSVANKRFQPFDVDIARPTKWGNRFSHLPHAKAQYKVGSRAEAVDRYIDWIFAPEQAGLRAEARRELRGKVLGCWCKPALCHGDVLAIIADGEESECTPDA